MGSCSSSKSNGGLQESGDKPLGDTSGGGSAVDPTTVQMFKVNPETMEDALGNKGRAKSIVDTLEGANPFNTGGAEGDFSANCQRCVTAYEARRRGYDVIAQPTYTTDSMPYARGYLKPYVNPVVENVGAGTSKKAQQNLEAKMREYGSGSRAIVEIPGHVFNCENVNGKIRYVDAQTNTVYSSNNVFSRLGRKSSQVSITRTDNLKFSDDIRKAVTPVTTTMKRTGRTKNTGNRQLGLF